MKMYRTLTFTADYTFSFASLSSGVSLILSVFSLSTVCTSVSDTVQCVGPQILSDLSDVIFPGCSYSEVFYKVQDFAALHCLKWFPTFRYLCCFS